MKVRSHSVLLALDLNNYTFRTYNTTSPIHVHVHVFQGLHVVYTCMYMIALLVLILIYVTLSLQWHASTEVDTHISHKPKTMLFS